MKKNRVISIGLLLVSNFFVLRAQAGDFEWSGIFRSEAYSIINSELDGSDRALNFGLNHLILRPRIEAADGLTIRSRFDIFNNDTYPDSQIGAVWGKKGAGSTTPATESQSMGTDTLQVSHLYLTLVQEFGALIVGRAPVHFGLGLTHNAGEKDFDHFLDTRDVFGYKIVMGNFYFLPIYAKLAENSLSKYDDVTELILHLQYDNPETGLSMGIYYQDRSSTRSGNDASEGTAPGEAFGGAGAFQAGRFDVTSLNIYAAKDTEKFRIGVEAGFDSGKTGIKDVSGNSVEIDAVGVAGELEYRPQDSKFRFGGLLGFATGDDPETDDVYEGFLFDRNYNVGFLLFNHPVGQANFLRTDLIGGGPDSSTGLVSKPDVDTVSNAFYAAPYVDYQWKEKWSLGFKAVTGYLVESAVDGSAKDLGFELDFSVNFIPNSRVKWVNQIGLLFPGASFEGDGLFDSEFAYGLVSKAAISF